MKTSHIKKGVAITILMFLVGAIATKNYIFLWNPEDALRRHIVSYDNSALSRWQVGYLLQSGISPGKQDRDGSTAYFIAFISENEYLLKSLPAYMEKLEIESLLHKIDEWPDTNLTYKKIADEALTERLRILKKQ
jgi:hypothetical protein